MRRDYFIIDNTGAEKGPVSYSTIEKYGININVQVWFKGMPRWVRAGTIPELKRCIKESGIEDKEYLTLEINREMREHLKQVAYKMDCKDEKIKSMHPKTWLIESILVAIFCSLPIGIVAIIYARRVKILWEEEAYAESVFASRKALLWIEIGIGVMLAFMLALVLVHLI